MEHKHTPVLIVGAGGAGLSLALLLRQQGIRSTVIERRPAVSWYPRARNLNFRTLEVFRGLGLEPEIVEAGSRVSRVFRKERLTAPDMQEFPDIEQTLQITDDLPALTPEPAFWHCPQSILEPILLAEARRREVDVRYGTELLTFAQDDDGVTATVADHTPGEQLRVHAEYLAGCDGARSRIREALGVPVDGVGALDEYYVFVYFRVAWNGMMRGHEADAIMVDNPDVHGFFLATEKDHGMLMIRYEPARGQSAADYTPERCRELIVHGIGMPDVEVEVEDVDAWRPAQQVAQQFQQGRTFLVGDAAHTMPPYLGLGVNTAIQSAQNLAWKLAAVLHGRADSPLLQTYHVERHPVADYVSRQSLTGPAASLLHESSREVANRAHAAELTAPPTGLFSAIIGYRYRSDAILSDDDPGAPVDRIELLPTGRLNGKPGTRVPHVWVERKGRRISTLDLVDGRFVLLAGPDGEPWCTAARSIADTLGLDLSAYRIGPDADLQDVPDSWGTVTGMPAGGAVLVRPDGFVAWRSGLPAEPVNAVAGAELTRAISTTLCRRAR